MFRNSVLPLPSDGKLDEECFSMFVWLCFYLLTIKSFFPLYSMTELRTLSQLTESLNGAENKRTITKG